MEVLAIRGRLHWGFSVREPFQSALQPPVPLPPPATLIGALARAVGGADSQRYAGLEKRIKWAAFGFDEEIPGLPLASLAAVDINRHLKAPYTRKDRRGLPEYKFAAVPTGKVYAPAFRAVLFYFGREASQLRDAAWGVFRLGSKESLFEVAEVEACKASSGGEGEVQTSAYVPKDRAAPVVPDYVMELVVWRSEGEKVAVYAPRMLEKVSYRARRVEFCGWEYVEV